MSSDQALQNTPTGFERVLSEMLCKERLRVEDFNSGFAPLFPQAYSVGAKAMDLSVAEFRSHLQQGLLNPHVVLSRMARLVQASNDLEGANAG